MLLPSPHQCGFTLNGPADAPTPLVLASPHSGRAYPTAFLAQTRLAVPQLRRAEDAYVDELVGGAPPRGVPVLSAHFGRAWLDLNRSADELDPAMYEEVLTPHPDQLRERVGVGLGVIPRLAGLGLPIYPGPIALAPAQARLAQVHIPYHAALATLIETARLRHGAAILIDCHSMPTLTGPTAARRAAPQIVLGDLYRRSAAPALVAAIESLFRDAGLRVAHNDPYAGGYTTQFHAQPQNGVHAVQIEIDRALYMDPARLVPNAGFARIAGLLTQMTAMLVANAGRFDLMQNRWAAQ